MGLFCRRSCCGNRRFECRTNSFCPCILFGFFRNCRRCDSFREDNCRCGSFREDNCRCDSFREENRRCDSFREDNHRCDSFREDDRRCDSFREDNRRCDSFREDNRRCDSCCEDNRRCDSFREDNRRCDSCCGCQNCREFIKVKDEYNNVSFIENTAELIVCGREIKSNTLVAGKLTKKCESSTKHF